MSAATALTQSNVADALRRALDDEANKKCGKWTASGEAAATSGVIDFLQKYMKDDAKMFKVKAGGKMKGEAARLAFTALEFANKCGGVELSFGGVAAADDHEDEEGEDAPAPAAKKEPNKLTPTQKRLHEAALNKTLLNGEQLWGRIKYLEMYKIPYRITLTTK